MRKFKVKVNGKEYEVEIEEIKGKERLEKIAPVTSLMTI